MEIPDDDDPYREHKLAHSFALSIVTATWKAKSHRDMDAQWSALYPLYRELSDGQVLAATASAVTARFLDFLDARMPNQQVAKLWEQFCAIESSVPFPR